MERDGIDGEVVVLVWDFWDGCDICGITVEGFRGLGCLSWGGRRDYLV